MADVESNIHVNIDTSGALASLKALQRQISAFHTQMAKSGTAASAVAANQAQNLMNSINATGQFQASMRTVTTSTEQFTNALEKNKLTSREYFRYTGAATKTFGRLFKSEFETINKVARERVKDIQTQYVKLGRGANGALQAIAVRPLTLDMKNLGTQTAMAAQKQQLLNQLLKQGSTNLLNFGKNTQWAGRQLMVGFTIPLVMLGTQAGKTFMKLEEQAIRFKRVYGELFTTQEETDVMVRDIQRLAKEYTKYGVAVEDTMKMAADAAAMGKMGADLTAQVAQATRLAVLGGVEQTQALETTISVTNAFGVATEDLAKKIDFLNAVENQTVVSIEDLTIAMPKAGPVIQQLGGDVEDLAFFLTAMKEGGINASEGANALKSGLASLINPSEKASKMLMSLGVNIKGIVEANAGDVKSTVIDFAAALDTLDPLNRARAIEQLFGKFQFSRLSTLFQNVTAQGTQASRVLELTKATTEELAILSERELARIENTTTYKFKKSIEDLKVTLAPVGEQFLKALTPIVEFAAKILDKFNDLGDGSKKFLTILTIALGAVGPVALMAFGLLANGVANIIKLFATMRSGFQRAGSSTQILGQQTNYLTQEQLEASAVAASLDQVHQRLRQTFTSEASAVNALASAYKRAIAAQVGFTGPVTGGAMRGTQQSKKYSTGITRVPGTGNQDTVPAMLTPGEAVIPADVAQDPRFKPIISSMVNKRLQGFNGGTSAVVAFGAHQPFTTAHESIATKAELLAKETGTDFIQYTSKGTKSKKGVVSLENRLKQIEESIGKPAVAVKDAFEMMEDLKNRGIKDVKIFLGTDRMQSEVFDLAAQKYEKYGMKLEKIEVKRVPGEKDVSATKIRDAVAAGNMDEANRLIAKGTSEETKKLIFDEIKENYKPLGSNKDNNKTNKSHVGGKSTPKPIDEIIRNNPNMTEDQRNKLITMSQIFKSQGLPLETFTKHGLIFDFPEWMNMRMPDKKGGIPKQEFIDEWQRRGAEKWSPSGMTSVQAKALDDAFLKSFLDVKTPNITDGMVDKIFREEVTKLVSPNDEGLKKAQKLYSTDSSFNIGAGLGTTPATSRAILDHAMTAIDPDTGKTYIKGYTLEERVGTGEGRTDQIVTKSSTVTLHDGTYLGIPLSETTTNMNRLGAGATSGISQKTPGAPVNPPELMLENMEKARSQEATIKAIADEAAKTKTGKKEPTDFGKQIAGTSGRSFDVKELGGVFEKPNGQKVFVKPMMTELEALAEKEATDFAREVQKIDTPKQKIKTMLDPTDPERKRKIIVLESKFQDMFDSRNMPKTFTEEEYFKQLTAANLRGDKDLKADNLGGNRLTDAGNLGIYDRASGSLAKPRNVLEVMPSLEEMAEENLKGIPEDSKAKSPRNSPNWFANATKDIALNLTPTQYQEKMEAEIKRQIAAMEPWLAKMSDKNPMKPYYTKMLERLRAGLGVDWTRLHQKHSSILVMPDEVQEDAKGNIKPIPTEPNNGKFKSDAGISDTRIADKSIAPAVRQRPRLRGKADAPDIDISEQELARTAPRGIKKIVDPAGALSQSALAAASRTELYGTGPIDPEQKALRRQLETLEKNSKRLSTVAKNVAVTQNIVTDNMANNVKKQGLLAKLQAKASNLQANAQQPMIGPLLPSGNFTATKLDKAKLKAGSMKYKTKQAITAGKGKGMGMGGGLMAASGVAMVASMAPGPVGEMAQKIMMPLMGLAMIAPMLTSALGLLTVAVGAIAAAYVYQRIVFDRAQKAAMKLTEAMGSGSEAIKNLSTFAGKVSAGEQMDRRRKESFSPFQIKTGKTTFGQSFIAGEQGKAMLQNVGKTVNSSGKAAASGQIVNQMATAVATGALTVGQAKSIVANLAKELGDYSFGIEVNGKLNELLGPNGENLLKDPIGVRLKILEDTRKRVNVSADQAKNAGGLGILAKKAFDFSSGWEYLQKGMLGKLYENETERKKNLGTASGAAVSMQKIAIEQQQEMLDSLELQYIKEMEIAKAKGDQAKMDALSIKYNADKSRLLKENGTLVGDIQKSFSESEGATRTALNTAVDTAITNQYKDTDFADIAEQGKTMIAGSGLSEEMQYTLKMQLASGQMDPMQIIEIFETFKDDKASMEAVATITAKLGGKFANQTMGIVGMFKDPKQSADFVARISTMTPEAAQDELELFQKLAQSDAVIGKEVVINYYNKNPKAAEEVKKSFDEIERLKGKIDLTVAAKVLGATAMYALRQDQEYFNSLPPEQQKVYLQNMKVMFSMQGDPSMQAQYKNWLNETTGTVGGTSLKGNQGKSFGDFVIAGTQQVTDASGEEPGVVKDGNSGANTTPIASSPLDGLLKQVRDVRKGSTKVTKGFDASFKSLDKMFGGTKTIKAFDGIENQLRGLGAGEDLIELIIGMDPDDYEAQKNKLFNFKDGKIVGLKENANNVQDVLDSVKLGDFVTEQEKMSKQIGNQTSALKRLKGAGVEGSIALEAVADATFAAKIANDKLSDEQLQEIVDGWKKTTQEAKEYAAVTNAINETSALQQRASLLTNLGKGFTDRPREEIEAIMGSVALQDLIATGQGNSQEFKDLLQQELNSANVELKIKAVSISGMQEIFDTGFSNAMQEFDTKENQLQLKFDIDNKQLVTDISKAENDISLIQFKIDDSEAALKNIADQEEKINEKYDERIQALDEVEKANASISQQQKGQLTLAEALTSGDIAAAARAAQDMRAQEAADNITKQKEAIEKSREFELSNIKSKDGKTRKQLEEDIKNLQDDIFNIEEETLEPNRESLRLSELALEADREKLTVLGKTRTAWEGIQNAVNLANVGSASFVKEMKDALDVYPDLVAGLGSLKTNTDPLKTPTPTPTPTPTQTEIDKAIELQNIRDQYFADLDSGQTYGESAKYVPSGFAHSLYNPIYRQYGGMVPKFFAAGGFAKGTDTVPAMLTPGEFIMSKYAVDAHGVNTMRAINNGQTTGGAVYNNTYTLTVNAKTNANPNEIAQAVMSTIKKVDDRRIRGVSLNA